MLDISDQTHSVFDSNEEREFLERLADFLRTQAPEMHDVDQDEHFRMTRSIVANARKFGFRRENDIATFALSAAVFGPDFHETMGGAKQILESDNTPEYRAKLLEYFTREMFEILAEN